MPLTRAPLSGVATKKGGNGIKDQWCGANPDQYLTDGISSYLGSTARPWTFSIWGVNALSPLWWISFAHPSLNPRKRSSARSANADWVDGVTLLTQQRVLKDDIAAIKDDQEHMWS